MDLSITITEILEKIHALNSDITRLLELCKKEILYTEYLQHENIDTFPYGSLPDGFCSEYEDEEHAIDMERI